MEASKYLLAVFSQATFAKLLSEGNRHDREDFRSTENDSDITVLFTRSIIRRKYREPAWSGITVIIRENVHVFAALSVFATRTLQFPQT